jgi:hypothetical protein
MTHAHDNSYCKNTTVNQTRQLTFFVLQNLFSNKMAVKLVF